jgi:alcohol dehydrogenase
MKSNFFFMPIPQYFGAGISMEIGAQLAQLHSKKALVMYDKGVEAAGIPSKIVQCIQAEGILVVQNGDVESDPSDTTVKRIAAIARQEQVDAVVAIGGGSSIDAAKCVKLLLNNSGALEDFYDLTRPQKPSGIPMIAIPTTSGTGSEASKGGVITDTSKGQKRTIIGPGTMPDMALVDPELTLSVPPNVTAACAFDVLAHAIDAITSNMTNPITQAISCEAIHLMKGSYRQAVEDGTNLQARSDMHLASNLGGIVLSNAKCSVSHAFAHAMGALYHVPHGVCCAIFTPACLEYVADQRPEEIRKIAELLNTPFRKDESVASIAWRAGETIHKMYRSVGVPDITEYIPDAAEAKRTLIPVAKQDIMATFSPRALDDAGAGWIIDRTFELARQ